MPKWVAIPILFALGLQSIAFPIQALLLEMERETVAIPMCINKERTDIQCLGSCYINRHLEAALAQTDQQSGETAPLSAPTLAISLQLPPIAGIWLLRTPLREQPVLRPHHPQWLAGDYRLPSWEPPRA